MERRKSGINNDFYDGLLDQWLSANDHPVALLRAENRERNPWILETITKQCPSPCRILDIGCGAGLLSNFLASKGHHVTGIDLSLKSLEVAKANGPSSATYLSANAESLPFEANAFDIVCAMDLLEHVEAPETVISEAARVLRPGGLFFFHTFNRTWLSYLLVIKGVEWFVKNTPEHMHVFSLFITPKELHEMCDLVGLDVEKMKGLRPKAFSLSFWSLLFSRKVSPRFRFIFTDSLKTGYVGIAKKR
jgi:2-polyprenyl-6-hydroxyphenyl methylase / 3-demethylubiquinone-9 3-methyltransferase